MMYIARRTRENADLPRRIEIKMRDASLFDARIVQIVQRFDTIIHPKAKRQARRALAPAHEH
jgi:hypothetical protein